jgi:tRNA (cytidine/uridine-2'-O-)-methyltransferase
MIGIALYQPEIPPNTGNIIRLCANTGCSLHLIEPLGFELGSARLRRAGLDYHEWTTLRRHADMASFLAWLGRRRLLAFSSHGDRPHTEVRYRREDVLLFGPESRGLTPDVLALTPVVHRLRIPMRPGSRSLNLSNAVAVAAYEAWRQLGFEGCAGAVNDPDTRA